MLVGVGSGFGETVQGVVFVDLVDGCGVAGSGRSEQCQQPQNWAAGETGESSGFHRCAQVESGWEDVKK